MRRPIPTSLESSREMAQDMANTSGKPFFVFTERGIVHSIQEGMRSIPSGAEKFVPQTQQV